MRNFLLGGGVGQQRVKCLKKKKEQQQHGLKTLDYALKSYKDTHIFSIFGWGDNLQLEYWSEESFIQVTNVRVPISYRE